MTTLSDLETAAELVHATIQPTPEISWPLLSERAGTEVWVKHENHTPIGAFKVRGGLVFMDGLRREHPDIDGVITATRGNHGQSVAFAARRHGLKATVVVPHGNSVEKNAAMRALGAELVEHGHDFQAAYEFAVASAETQGLFLLPSFHDHLWRGVASYSLELFRRVADIDTLYVPIGLGSGICGAVAARDALGLATKIVGVVSVNAPAYALSMKRKAPVSTNSADTIADGVACRVPVQDALDIIFRGVERIAEVTEAEICAAMRYYYTDTHNVAEGAGAAPLAALLQEKHQMQGRRVALVLTGGNIDRDVFRDVLVDDWAPDKTKE